jgi:hypothetical protein
MNSALDRALGSIPWESNNSRDLARNFFAPLVKRDEDTGEFMIEGVALETFIMAEIPERFPNLMASKTKTASGAQPGTGTGSKPAKPAPIDFDALTSQSTKAELEAAAKHLASVLALSN